MGVHRTIMMEEENEGSCEQSNERGGEHRKRK